MSALDLYARWRKSSYSDASGGDCVEVASWVKSSRSGSEGGTCVEAGSWQKSTHSDSSGGACVEVGEMTSGVALRDSKDPEGPKLAFGRGAFGVLVSDIRAGRYDK
ncbi:DUF397 domain-containing protein [Spirillospora sp. NPDC046719]